MRSRNRILAAVFSAAMLGGCTGYESSAEQDGMYFYISKNERKAFVSECAWDVNSGQARVVIPPNIEKASVTSLGGFFGTGVPSPFCIMGERDTFDFNGNPYRSEYGAPLVFEDVPVTVVIPDTVTEVRLASGTGYYGSRNEYGQIVFRRPVVRFECGETNPEFTAEDGQLLLKKDLSPAIADSGLYGGEELPEMTLRDKLLCRCVKDMGDEKEVWDIFPEFGHVYIHINSYMYDDEYMFSALELIPVEEGVLERTDTDTFDAEVRQFSDFAMAGQYTEPESPYCRITVSDDYVEVVQLDENREPLMDSGIQIDKDITQPSQFAVTTEDLERVNDGNKLVYLVGHTWANAETHVLEGDGVRVRMYRDGTFTINRDAENATVLYRGIAMGGYGMEDNDLRFAVKKLGGTTEPIVGRVRMTVEEDTVTFTAVDGYDSEPLIPAGADELVCRIS